VKLLKNIEDNSFSKDKKIKVRFAVRAVLFDENGLIPILFASKPNYHKLPGGGIETGEDKMIALDREIKEETGCTAEIQGEIGSVTEYRSKWNLYQTSYCYVGKVIKKGTTSFTKSERKKGFEPVWLNLETAIETLKKDKSTDYEGKFIQERDLAFLEEAKKIIVGMKEEGL
jgi:ADP-ribose pyrophosphatase YjhB (NUDIX family)